MSATIVMRTRDMLEVLTIASHRGPSDTWTAARDRAAKKIGVKPTYAKRIWDRWQTMKDCSAEAYEAIRNAYDEQCEFNEHMAALHRQRAEEKRHGASHKDGMAAHDSMA